MRHYFDFVPNATTGAAVPGAIVKLFDASDTLIDIFADENGTPIEAVSGVTNGAKTDGDGMFSLYVANGLYTARFYVGGAVLKTIRNVELSQDVTELALGADTGAALVGTAAGETVQGALDGLSVATRAALAALNPRALKTAYLTEAGREGQFVCRAGTAPTDPLQGIYVASDTTGYYWERVWDGIYGRPEWFGAVAGSPSLDCAPPIQACNDLCPGIKFSAGIYYIGDGTPGVGVDLLAIEQNGKSWIGAGVTQVQGHGATNATKLMIRSASATGLRVGPASDPGGPGVTNWTEGVELNGFVIERDVANFPLGNPPSGVTNAPCGFKAQWARVCYFRNVYLLEHSIGCWYKATVACEWTNVRGERFISGTAPGNDFAIGLYEDNTLPTPFNSGNASVRIFGGGFFSNMAAGNSYTYAAAIQTVGGFTDTLIENFEGANCGYGFDFSGVSSSAADWHTEDLIVRGCVLDGIRWDGIRFTNCGGNTAATIKDNYIGLSNATGPVSNGLNFSTVNGSFTVGGNQVIATPGNPACGLRVFNSSGVQVSGDIYTNLQDPVILDGLIGGKVDVRVNAALQSPATAAIQLSNTRDTLIVAAAGAPGPGMSIPAGVKLLGVANARVEVNCTQLIGANITGGSANKLIDNGTPRTTTGTFGNNCLASGVMA